MWGELWKRCRRCKGEGSVTELGDPVLSVDLTPEQRAETMVNGGTYHLVRKVPCPKCGGTGESDGQGPALPEAR